ncbi:hypothetical protein RI129_013044 [Pyrocoelia pectoralis]|uniref:THAP-type domain-containing protein n=1 Tax=Pyrocoelia pectoralis TaxID=417401 RepID=A0AAN7V8G2_9COLE
MPFCMVVNCGRTSIRDGPFSSFFRIPSKFNNNHKIDNLRSERRKKWIAALKRSDLTELKLKYGRVCSKHFIAGKPAQLSDTENPDWVPSQNLGYTSSTLSKISARSRYVRAMKRRIEVTPLNYKLNIYTKDEQIKPPISMESLDLALRECNRELYELRAKVNQLQFTQEYFVNSDQNTLYYTGLPTYQHLQCLYELVESDIVITHSSKLSKFQQLILVLIKLRLNLPFIDLGNRFSCSRTTVSRIFFSILEILYDKLQSFIIWPDRDDLRTNVPRCFKENFSNTSVIVDCFEVFIEKPSNLQAATKTWSNYKHHHTVKFLIGITPQGAICYISNAYGGRASDKFITEDCDFLDNLVPGDLVLADRGFLINNSVELCYAKLLTPAFKRGKKQLSAKEVEDTRTLAHVRIHVERVIGILRQKYVILRDTLPIEMLKKKCDDDFSFIDKLVVVCCGLINLGPPIISLE